MAKLAQSYGRNPIEAMVAAGMLTSKDAGAALSDADRKFLQTIARRERRRTDAEQAKILRPTPKGER